MMYYHYIKQGGAWNRKEIIILFYLCYAVFRDLKTYRIDNRLIVVGLAAGAVWSVYEQGFQGLFYWLAGCAVPIFLLFLLFIWKVIGAGDIKLFSVVGGFFGVSFLFKWIPASFCLGAVISLSQMFYFRIFKKRFLYFIRFFKQSIREKRIQPYYSADEQGRECVIHFSLAMLGACIYCLQMQL